MNYVYERSAFCLINWLCEHAAIAALTRMPSPASVAWPRRSWNQRLQRSGGAVAQSMRSIPTVKGVWTTNRP